ncbi:MAG: hypothetical protein AAB624_00755 [Patescibacteria group bacterium]
MRKLIKKRKLPSQTRGAGKTRKKRLPEYQSFRLQQKIKIKNYKPLPSAWKLWKSSLQMFWKHKRTIGLFLLVYAVLYIIFVRGLSGGINLGELREELKADNSTATSILTSVTLFGVLVSTSGTTSSETASIYQGLLLVVGSLAFIWLLRQLSGDKPVRIRIRDAFYRGMQPLIPFLIVMFVIALEFTPLSIGGFILNIVMANGLAGSGSELFGIYVICILLVVLSLYLVSGTLAALYIVTLPGMEPLRAIRASHQVLRMHRWSVVRKFVLLVLFLLGAGLVIFIPLLLAVPSSLTWINEYIFFAGSVSGFAIFHIYMYNLYKSLL